MARGRRPEWARTGGDGWTGRGSGEGPAGDATGGTGRPAVDCRWLRRLGLSERRLPRASVSRHAASRLGQPGAPPAGRPVRMPEEGPEKAETL